MPRVLLDTNVFIFAIEHPRSNSNIAIEMAIDGEIEVIVSEEIKLELIGYLKSEYGRDTEYYANLFLENLPSLKIVESRNAKNTWANLKAE
ncbi:MAG: PIN domain-containing protein [Euryarchaeota archaeon]|nr:PIN domain-containing protein [Euryarchaeota archaeon]